MVTIGRKKNYTPTGQFTHKDAIDNLVEEFYQVKAGIRAYGMHEGNKATALAERKYELMLLIKKELGKVSKRKGDKIRKKLWNELGVVI